MSDELVKWECPNCGDVDEDIDLQETHCSGCGLVVFVSDGDAVSQKWFVNPRPTRLALDFCPECLDTGYRRVSPTILAKCSCKHGQSQ